MSAAIRAHDLGLDVLVVEKSDRWGGSTAMSGGVCWMGANPSMIAAGLDDNTDDVMTYLRHITEGEVSDDRLRCYVDECLRVFRYYEEHTHVRFDAIAKYTDYYPEAPGGRPGGRSMESRPFDGTQVGEDLRTLRAPHPQSQILGKFGITAGQAQVLLTGGWKAKAFVLWCFFLYALRWPSRRKYGRDTKLYTGNALCARLRRSLQDRDVPVWLNTGVKELVFEDGRAVGVVVERDGVEQRIRAERGVLLAAGGFERNQSMRDRYQRTPITDHWTAANPHNMGDGINMGIEAGAAVDLMREAWWTPTTLVPKSELGWVLVVEKNLPGSIFVDREGKRFSNEAAPYVDAALAMYEADAMPCHMVFDATFRHNYPVGPVAPGYAMPDNRVPRRYRGTFLISAPTLDELADKIGVDAGNLAATVERFNGFADKGVDEDFGRGKSASDRYYGDHRVTPNPCLAPLSKPPYYAIAVYPGDLGTKGGLVTDNSAQVLDVQGQIIPGLYAAGNNSASVMGRTYPGAGGTIGPALTFGFLAGEAAANEREAALAS